MIIFGKIEKFLFCFLFFAIPFQTRKILYSSGWYYNEWQAVSIYATDIILFILFVFWFFNGGLRPKALSFKLYDWFLLGFLAAAAISVKNSSDMWVGWFHWLKLAEFSLFYFYLKNYAVRKFNFITVLYVLLLGGAFQAAIAIGQFLKQGSLGLTSFGESVIGPHMVGIASFFIASGEKVIRAYGTTPHPNVLAAYLFLCIFAFYFLVLYSAKKSLIYWAYPVMIVGFFFTFSRTIIFLWAVGVSARMVIGYFTERFRHQFWDNEFIKAKILKAVWLTLITCLVFAVIYWPEIYSRMTISAEEEAVKLRVFYNEESLKGGINLFGIGPGDFTGWLMEQKPNLPRYMYQPVHNIYLLVYSEIGVLALIFLLLFIAGLIFSFIKETKLRELRNWSFLLVTLSVLFMGLFDHFLLTLQQGRFVLWLGLTLLVIGDIMEAQFRKERGWEIK